ncbi:helix-turn-helix domain-containing protein [Alteromonas sp. McT4-15]|uniref:helix-turn-helix domain-containing protein n=1 Tax=Alteromonas sp. McT4-15 TaxID=2881256 RepID=UPI001CF8D212|nr:helix-turn-helix domain-containing protein [Alteromonas sp. McT4-15]MCB4438499.1 helix-turn-helix domain-containing protein [Alteromonas sp. McT4-15]
MARSYSVEVRSKVLEKVKANEYRVSEIARQFGISKSTIYYWISVENRKNAPSKEQFIRRKLEEKLQKVSEEREVLIKAFSIFARKID